MHALPALAAVAVCLAVVILAVTALRSRAPTGEGPASSLRSKPGWNASDGQHPSLSALMAHLAVLRRPATAADRAAVRRFGYGVGAAPGRTQYPTLVRLAGDANGIPVYFVVDAARQHGASGPAVGYSMQVDANEGINYIAGNYVVFPTVVGSEVRGPREYFSVVPDGVRTARWRFACPATATGCMLPPAGRTVSVPVRDNLAVWPVPSPNPGTYYADAVSVTWYRDDGTHTTYTNQYSAVPFAGAPALPSRRPSPQQRPARGNGPPAGEPLAHWRAMWGVLRRPQDASDRSAAAKAAAVTESPIVPDLTRVVLDADRALVFITLSAVNPGASAADRRYVATFWSVSQASGQTQSQGYTAGAQIPQNAFVGPSGSLPYSIVPDDVTKVAWQVKCTGCGRLSGSPLVLTAHHNVVYSLIQASSLSINQGTWYRRGGTPLRFGP